MRSGSGWLLRGLLGVWDVPTGAEVRRFGTSAHSVNSIALSRDGRLLVGAGGSYGEDRSAYAAHLWEFSTGQELRQFAGNEKEVLSVAFSPDASVVLTAGRDGATRMWSTSTAKVLKVFQSASHSTVHSAVFSPDGTLVLTGSEDNLGRLGDVDSAELRTQLGGRVRPVESVAASSDRHLIATGDDSGSINLWDATTGRQTGTLKADNARVTHLTFSSDNHFLLAGSGVVASPDSAPHPSVARLWRLSDRQLVRTFSGHGKAVNSVAFSPDGTSLITSSADRTARTWNIAAGTQEQQPHVRRSRHLHDLLA